MNKKLIGLALITVGIVLFIVAILLSKKASYTDDECNKVINNTKPGDACCVKQGDDNRKATISADGKNCVAKSNPLPLILMVLGGLMAVIGLILLIIGFVKKN
jgi:hypothetical protein